MGGHPPAIGAPGTMPNRRAVTLTPGTSPQPIAAGYHNGAGYCAGDPNLVSSNILGGVSIFGVKGSAFRTEPLQTGQSKCYDLTSSNIISCASTGQDGELQKGAVRQYHDDGNGTITDSRAGLMWEKLSYDDTVHDYTKLYSWKDAFTNQSLI